jgi:hypothetical protein
MASTSLVLLGGISAFVVTTSGCGGGGYPTSTFHALDGSAGSSGGGGDATAYDGPALSDGSLMFNCGSLACNQVSCADGGTTSLSGTVYDPAGKVPLYNVVVYIPTTQVQPITTGATCDPCGGEATGNPLVSALTDATGHFVLTNVPAGVPIPLVLQLGKWRRQITVPAVRACATAPLTNINTMRLPKNHTEGDIPHIALTTGGADPLECLLRKIGIDDAEFTTAGGTGRVHLYAGSGVPGEVPPLVASSSFAPSLNGGAVFADAQTMWDSPTTLDAYDIVLMACEGQQNAGTKPPAALQAMSDFESQGGRVFASHWHDYWFEDGPPPLPSTGSWTDLTPPPPDPSDGMLDTSFPKGQAFHDWLANVGGLDANGQLPIHQPKHNLNSAGVGAQQWITLQNPNTSPPGQTAVEYMTFNTPLDVDAGAQCGRVVYSDLHVSSGATNDAGIPLGDETGQPFPNGCVTTDLSPQEKALEFMLFDLSSCIQNDSQSPQPPQ